MNVPLITVDKEQAREKLRAYRRDRHKDAEEEYRACAEAYEALAEGTPLVDIEQAIRSGGFDDKMRPRLAIAAADRKQVRFTWSPNQPVAEFDARRSTQFSARLMIFIDMKRLHGLVRQRRLRDGTLSTFDAYVQGYARVPMVPADVRPETGQLRDWHILWEVDEWADRPFLAEPPRDPLLLKHIRGSLYAVLAQWDLTELERAVMRETLVR